MYGLAGTSAAYAANGKYIIAGSAVFNGSDKGMIIGLDNSGLTATSFLATPFGPKDASFPVYNPTSGYLMYGGSRPGASSPVGVFNLADYIDSLPAPVSTYNYNGGGLFDSEWEADPGSGKFFSAVRGGPFRMVSFDPTTGVFDLTGATQTMGIPEATWLYNGDLYSVEESNNRVWRVALAGGTTTGAMSNLYDLSANGVANSQGSYSEYFSATTFNDGTTLTGTFSTNLYLFDIDTQPNAGVGVTTINLLSHLTTSGGGFNASDGYVSGIEHDESTGLFYVLGTLRDGSQGFIGSDFLVAVDKSGNVTPILQEINGDTLLPVGDSYGLGFAEFSPVPEPASFVLAGLGLVALGWFGRRRYRSS